MKLVRRFTFSLRALKLNPLDAQALLLVALQAVQVGCQAAVQALVQVGFHQVLNQ